MYSTTTLAKSSKFTGRIVGTHQQLDLAARKLLGKHIPINRYFPSGKDIIYFEGVRGPDGLKRKSPGIDEPQHMLLPESPANTPGHEQLDERSVTTMILDHRWNLIRALKAKDQVRAAFEASWMAHMITDGLTPAHHFPLPAVQDELMTDKEMVRVLGAPIKGIMHGRSFLETMRNNWLYWGAKGHMSQHIAYEYGVLMIAATLPRSAISPKLTAADFENTNIEEIFANSLQLIQSHKIYDRFRADGWTTDLAFETKDFLLPEIIRAITLGWYSAIAEANPSLVAKKHSNQNRKSNPSRTTKSRPGQNHKSNPSRAAKSRPGQNRKSNPNRAAKSHPSQNKSNSKPSSGPSHA